MIAAIIQARISSTRLPRKVLLPLGDTTVLGMTVRQVGKAKHIGEVIVATSDSSDDDAIEVECKKLGVACFRGSLTDVLDRYYNAAKDLGASAIGRFTADCPVIDPSVIDLVATAYERGGIDYSSTGRTGTTFPDGMDTEIISFDALERAWKEAKLPSEREHVTPYIWNHPNMFRLTEVRHSVDLSNTRLTIDEPQDYEVLKKIIAGVHPLTMDGMVKYLVGHPEVAALNGSIMRDEGYAKSLKEDKTYEKENQ